MTQPVTGKYSHKKYQCPKCQHEYLAGTNHCGEIYSPCPKCRAHVPQQCLETVPEGYGIPDNWTTVKLGDIVEISET